MAPDERRLKLDNHLGPPGVLPVVKEHGRAIPVSWVATTIALRDIRRRPLQAIIKIAGLAVGLAAVLFVGLFARFESSFDRHHPHADRIFRVIGPEFSGTPFLAGERWKETVPGIEAKAAVKRVTRAGDRIAILADGRNLGEDRLYVSEPSFFRVFGARFLQGTAEGALSDPRSVVLSESAARRFFGTTDCLGRVIQVAGRVDLQVRAVTADPPAASHFAYGVLAPIDAQAAITGYDDLTQWGSWNYHNYIRLGRQTAPGVVEAALSGAFPEDFRLSRRGGRQETDKLRLQRLAEIHLGPALRGDFEPVRDRRQILLFAGIGVLILMVSCVNFINLSTAHSLRRFREIGLRKVLGAGRGRIVRQLLAESLAWTALSAAAAVVLLYGSFPALRHVSGSALAPADIPWGLLAAGLAGLVLIVGSAAGIYPALAGASFQPIRTLKGEQGFRPGRSTVRNALLIGQFILSFGFVAAALIMHAQMRFVRSHHPGIDAESLIAIRLPSGLAIRTDALKHELLRIPGVVSVSASGFAPGRNTNNQDCAREGQEPGIEEMLRWFAADADFVDALGLTIVEGRGFRPEDQAAGEQRFLINEAAARRFGWQDAEGKRLSYALSVPSLGAAGRVIGVFEDFHFRSLHYALEPLAVMAAPPLFVQSTPRGDRVHSFFSALAVRVSGRDLQETIRGIDAFCREHIPEDPDAWSFFDEAFGRMYAQEALSARFFVFLALLASGLAALGVFGLAAFTVERRRREISIRRVLGAPARRVVALFADDFLRLLVLAAVAAAPVVLILMNGWLSRFAYRVALGPWFFAAAFLIMALLLITAVGSNLLRGLAANPADNLRNQ